MLTSDLNLSKNCKRIEILKCVLKNVHYYYYYYYRHEDTQTCLTWRDRKVCENVWPLGETTINLQLV